MKKYLLPLICILSFAYLPATNYDMINLTNKEGLSNSSINTVFQNSKGLMWFGTWDGLNVYNGREFKVFKPIPGDDHSISNNIIRDLLEEKEDTQWIATDFGINRLNTQTNTFERFFVEDQNQIVYNEHSFLIAKNSYNQIFAAVYGQGFFYFEAKERKFVQLKEIDAFLFKKIFFDLDDNLWIHTKEENLFKVVFKKGTINGIEIQNLSKFQHADKIISVFYDGNNEIWMQNSDLNLFSYHISEGVLQHRLNLAADIGISGPFCFKIIINYGVRLTVCFLISQVPNK